MIRINCPFCGPRDHSEFSYEGDGSVVYPPLDAPHEAWCDAVYLRQNARGPALELWQHVGGCRAFLLIERDTLSHEIRSVRYATPGMAEALADPAREAAE
ncbi:MAG: sarcosine oxidase subunit delta [Pseudomonadota bacterium]